MLYNPFKCNNRQKSFRTQKNEKHRALRIENLEKREMLSAVGITNNNLYEDLTGYYSFENGIPEENCVVLGESEVLFSETLNSNVLSLDGDGDFVNLGNPAEMNFDGEITLSAWVKAEATNGIRNIITHGHTTNPKAEVFLRINNGYFEIGSWDGTNHQARTQILASDVGAWVHIAGTYDGTDWKLYRNGTEVASVTDSVGALQVNDNWYIGADGTRGERFFDGMLDNVTLHNQALSATQIQELAQKTHRGTICHYSCSYNEENLLLDDENALHGIFEGDAEIRTDLDYGDYLSLNGSNSYVNLQNEEILNFSGEITLAAWVKPETTNGTQNIIAHGYTRNPNKEVSLRIINGQYQVGAWNGADYYATASIPSEDVGTWVHIAGTYDGTTWHLYRNGVEIASQTASVGAMPLNSNWCIGASGSGTERFYRGGIDEVIIADKALSVTEIEELAAPREILMPTPVEGWSCASSDVGILYGVNGNVNGELKNGVYFAEDTTRGSVLDFTNNHGYVTLGDAESMQITGEIALSAWINPNSADGIQNIITKGFTQNPKGEISLRINNGKYEIGSWNGANHFASADIPDEDIGSWVHLLGTYDGSTWKLFRNGELFATRTDSVGAISVEAPWIIGACSTALTGDNNARYFDGQITDIQVFNTQVTALQAQAFSNANQKLTPDTSDVLPVTIGGETYGFCGSDLPYQLHLNSNGQLNENLKIDWEVNWGDSNISHYDSTTSDDASHTYATSGTYTITVKAKVGGKDIPVVTNSIDVKIYETGNLIANGDFEATPIPEGHPWWIFNNGQSNYDDEGNIINDNSLEGWSGLIEIQGGEAELDADAHQQDESHPSREACGCRTSITSDSFELVPGETYTLTFSSRNRSDYAEDNMVSVTVPGTITHINDETVSSLNDLIAENANQPKWKNRYACLSIDSSSVTYSAGGTQYREEVGEDEYVTHTASEGNYKVSSITFIASQSSGTVTFSDASADDVIPSFGPYIDDVSLPAKYVIADIDVDSNNDGSIDVYDDPVETDGVGTPFGKMIYYGHTFTANLNVITDIPYDQYIVQLSGGEGILEYTQPTIGDNSVEITVVGMGETFLTYKVLHSVTGQILALDIVTLKPLEVKVDMAFNYDRLDNTGNDGINIRYDGNNDCEREAPELAQNDFSDYDPEHGSVGNGEVLYLANKDVDVYARFVVPPAFAGISLQLSAFSDTLSINGLYFETIQFGADGVSSGTKTIAGKDGFVAFDTISSTSNSISKEVGSFTWSITQINGTLLGTEMITFNTAPLTVYTVLDIPKDPWNVEDTISDDMYVPWVTALDYACSWANSQTTPDEAIAEITRKAYSDFGKTYGNSSYVKGSKCNLMQIMKMPNVDCCAISAVVILFSQVVGIKDVQYLEIMGPFQTNSIKLIGTKNWLEQSWIMHQVVLYDKKVYSACELLGGEARPTQAIGMTIDEYKVALYNVCQEPFADWYTVSPFYFDDIFYDPEGGKQ
ncbi:MAG: LamG-like jellyroll fold domain-containing protein [Planctomycetia bacterium]|nr:LamG-like jellyroll fold domain-containing protein [Planctomycetia bacterium]